MGHFLQIMIARKTRQFLLIVNCRKGPLSANHNRKKYSTISQEIPLQYLKKNNTISRDCELQKWAIFWKTIQFIVIAVSRNEPAVLLPTALRNDDMIQDCNV